MTSGLNHLSKAKAVIVAQVEVALPALAATLLLVDRFVAMVRDGIAGDLVSWLKEAATSGIASFACGIGADQAAVVAAMTEPWSNGQTEGQINRLKTLKRQMYRGHGSPQHHEARHAPTLIKSTFRSRSDPK